MGFRVGSRILPTHFRRGLGLRDKPWIQRQGESGKKTMLQLSPMEGKALGCRRLSLTAIAKRRGCGQLEWAALPITEGGEERRKKAELKGSWIVARPQGGVFDGHEANYGLSRRESGCTRRRGKCSGWRHTQFKGKRKLDWLPSWKFQCRTGTLVADPKSTVLNHQHIPRHLDANHATCGAYSWFCSVANPSNHFIWFRFILLTKWSVASYVVTSSNVSTKSPT